MTKNAGTPLDLGQGAFLLSEPKRFEVHNFGAHGVGPIDSLANHEYGAHHPRMPNEQVNLRPI